MGLNAYYLGDTSAISRLRDPAVGTRLVPLLEAGLVARCTPTDLEVGFSSMDTAGHRALRARRATWPLAPMSQAVLDRAVEVQDELVEGGQHRAVKLADLLIAAAAEAADLTVLHYDKDFDLIAAVTRQPVEWVVPAGSVS